METRPLVGLEYVNCPVCNLCDAFLSKDTEKIIVLSVLRAFFLEEKIIC